MVKTWRAVFAVVAVLVAALAAVLVATAREPQPQAVAGKPVSALRPGAYASVRASGAARRGVVSPRVVESVKNDVSPPLASILSGTGRASDPDEQRDAEETQPAAPRTAEPAAAQPDPVVQAAAPSERMPAAASFDGVSAADAASALGFGLVPPDPDGDVGRTDYVQVVNSVVAVYSKAGVRLFGPKPISVLWTGFGGVCENDDEGDPIVQYDGLADRWLVSQFGFDLSGGNPVGPYYGCIAVSTSGDPTGSYYRYAFKISDTKLDDYPKIGVWPDGYYMSVNQFDGPQADTWAGAAAVVFERSQMLVGQPARMVSFGLFSVDPNLGGMLPSDLVGTTPPPDGTPNVFAQIDDDNWLDPATGGPIYPRDQLELWKFHVDWTNVSASSFRGKTLVPVAAFDSRLCGAGGAQCIQQPSPGGRLDAIDDRLMFSAAWRNVGAYQSLVLDHAVDVGGDRAGVRWYELRDPAGSPSVFQQGRSRPRTARAAGWGARTSTLPATSPSATAGRARRSSLRSRMRAGSPRIRSASSRRARPR